MNKLNYSVIFFKKINLLINSLLEKYLNKLKFKNISNFIVSNKVFWIFLATIVLFISYLLIPHVYNKAEVRKELENQLLDKFRLDFVFSKNFDYHFFPRPHFIIEGSSILENHVKVSDIKKLSIFVSLDNLFSLKNIIVKDVILENSNFNFNKKNSNFFIKLLDNNFFERSFNIKNSKVFFKNSEQEVLFINKIINMKYYYDPKELKNIINSKNEIFNIPYSLQLYNDKDKKKLITKIDINSLKFQIKNELNYDVNPKKGLLNLIYYNKKSQVSYELNDNYFNFIFSEKKIEPNFIYKGNISLNPFYSTFNGSTDKIDLFTFFDSNSLFSQLFKTEILNNDNLNIELNINAKKIIQIQNIIDLIFNFKIQEGLTDIDNTKFSWSDYAYFEILDSLLYVSDNQLILDGKLVVDISNYDKIYKYLQTSKNLRADLKKIEFNFNYNFDQQIINFNSIKINNQINKKVNNIVKEMILKKDKTQNKILFRNIMRVALAAYAG